MALGDFTLFEEFKATMSNLMDLDADTIRLAVTNSTTTPTAALASPTLGLFTEVTAGGNYVAGGTDVTATYVEAAGTATFDGVNVTWLQNAANPTNARWCILYDDTLVANDAIGFFDLGSVFDMTTGDLIVNFHASGIFTAA